MGGKQRSNSAHKLGQKQQEITTLNQAESLAIPD